MTESLLRSWVPFFSQKYDYDVFKGCVEDLDSVDQLIMKYELNTTTKFASHSAVNKNFGNTEVKPKENNYKVYFKHGYNDRADYIDLGGTPFIVINSKVFCCSQGPIRRKVLNIPVESCVKDHDYETPFKKTVRAKHRTSKIDCPSKIYVKELLTFPIYKMELEEPVNKRIKSEISRNVKYQLDSGNYGERVFYVCLPTLESHNHRTDDSKSSGEKQRIDSRITRKINEIVSKQGLTDIYCIKMIIKDFVENELQSIDGMQYSETNRRFYPRDKDLRNSVYRAVKSSKNASSEKITEENMVEINNIIKDDLDDELTDDAHDEIEDEIPVTVDSSENKLIKINKTKEFQKSRCKELLNSIEFYTDFIQNGDDWTRIHSMLQEVQNEAKMCVIRDTRPKHLLKKDSDVRQETFPETPKRQQKRKQSNDYSIDKPARKLIKAQIVIKSL